MKDLLVTAVRAIINNPTLALAAFLGGVNTATDRTLKGYLMAGATGLLWFVVSPAYPKGAKTHEQAERAVKQSVEQELGRKVNA